MSENGSNSMSENGSNQSTRSSGSRRPFVVGVGAAGVSVEVAGGIYGDNGDREVTVTFGFDPDAANQLGEAPFGTDAKSTCRNRIGSQARTRHTRLLRRPDDPVLLLDLRHRHFRPRRQKQDYSWNQAVPSGAATVP
ncbi:hypothetical protein ACLI4Q_17850 [Natrialbaceae archaeon A-CW1-1]